MTRFEFIFNKIHGSLCNALIGDAMGSATEMMTPDEIRRTYNGRIVQFHPPAPGTFAAGRRAGQLTDDSTQMLEIVDAILESGDQLKIEKIAEHLLTWADDAEMLKRFAGPSTRKALALLREGRSPYETGLPERTLNDLRVSNGAAMKVAPAGLAHPGDLKGAIADAVLISTPTHCTNIAFSGAAAVAAAVAEALTAHPTPLSVADAAIYGAEEGDRIGKEQGNVVAGPSMCERLRLAVEIGATARYLDEASARLAAVIGCGLHIAEAVPTAIGTFVAARGEPNQAVTAVVNLGDDSDTVATITGAIAGAYAGFDALNRDLVDFLMNVNQLDLKPRVEALTRLALTRIENASGERQDP